MQMGKTFRMSAVRLMTMALPLSVAVSVSATAGAVLAGDLVFETARFTLRVGSDACAKSLIVKATGEECLDGRENVPLFASTQDRPFNNETKLAYPSKRTTYPADRVHRREDGRLVVGFRLAPYEAVVRVTDRDGYLAFTLEDFAVNATDDRQYRRLMMDVPPVDSFRLVQLPVRERANFGEWLNVVWDDKAAVAVVATDPFGVIDHVERPDARWLTADLLRGQRLRGGSAALVVGAGKEPFLDALAQVEEDFDLPRGVAARRNPLINASICWTDTLDPTNVQTHIDFAKRGGFRLLLTYHTGFTDDRGWGTLGDYRIDTRRWPRGYDDVRDVLARFRAAGILPGVHLLQTHIGLKNHYVTPVADPRLNHTRRFTLSRPLACETNSCDVYVEENPVDAVRHPKCRVLQFGGELFHYDDYVTEPPYRFTGCRRGHNGTHPQAHPCGQVGGVLDISEYAALSCYIDQRTSLQDEIAGKIARLYDCGFAFAYLDGSEGVNPPCGINVSYAQYRVTRRFRTPPLFTEGAAKSHFGWHLQAGANAYDVFAPEVFKEKITAYPQAAAPLMRRNFTRIDFGWWQLVLPGDTPLRNSGISPFGTQPDQWEWGTSRAAAWDCPATIHLNPSHFARHPRADDLLEVMRRWEDVRARGWLSAAQKDELKSTTQEHHLLVNGRGDYELVPVREIKDVAGGRVRAFVFARNSHRVVTLWHATGSGTLQLPEGSVTFTRRQTPDGATVGMEKSCELSARVYLETEASEEAVCAALTHAVLK